MKSDKQNNKIKCTIFKSKNEAMSLTTEAINKAENVEKKAHFAKGLIKEANALLSCNHFTEKKTDCTICRLVAKARKRAANLILKVKELKIKNN